MEFLGVLLSILGGAAVAGFCAYLFLRFLTDFSVRVAQRQVYAREEKLNESREVGKDGR